MKERNSQTGIALELYIRVCLITPQLQPGRRLEHSSHYDFYARSANFACKINNLSWRDTSFLIFVETRWE